MKNMTQRKLDFINAMGNESAVILNENQGTVTITFSLYYRMRHDSVMLALIMNNPCKEIDEILAEYRESDFLGRAFAIAQTPMTDIEAMSFVYGVPKELIEKTILEEELNGQ